MHILCIITEAKKARTQGLRNEPRLEAHRTGCGSQAGGAQNRVRFRVPVTTYASKAMATSWRPATTKQTQKAAATI